MTSSTSVYDLSDRKMWTVIHFKFCSIHCHRHGPDPFVVVVVWVLAGHGGDHPYHQRIKFSETRLGRIILYLQKSVCICCWAGANALRFKWIHDPTYDL